MANSAIEVTIFTDGTDEAAVRAVKAAFGHLDTDGVDVVNTTGDLDDVLREAVAKAADTDGKDLIVIVTEDGSHDDWESAKRSLAALAADGNMTVIVTTGTPSADVAKRLRWADDDAPFADSVDLLSVAELPGTEVAKWAKTVAA